MKLAYLIIAHTDPKHLRRLVDALNVLGKTDFYVHVDSKADIAPFKAELNAVMENVRIKEKRVYTTWGVFSSSCLSESDAGMYCLGNGIWSCIPTFRT